MKRLIVLALVLSACSAGGPGAAHEAAAPPTIVKALPVDAIAAFMPAPEPGAAVITFGVSYDRHTMEIPKALTRFKRTFPQIAWRAELSRGVVAASVTWSVAIRADSGLETTVFSVDEPIDGPDVTVLANSGDLAGLVGNKPGTYVMRYADSGQALAEGTFTLVK